MDNLAAYVLAARTAPDSCIALAADIVLVAVSIQLRKSVDALVVADTKKTACCALAVSYSCSVVAHIALGSPIEVAVVGVVDGDDDDDDDADIE